MWRHTTTTNTTVFKHHCRYDMSFSQHRNQCFVLRVPQWRYELEPKPIKASTQRHALSRVPGDWVSLHSSEDRWGHFDIIQTSQRCRRSVWWNHMNFKDMLLAAHGRLFWKTSCKTNKQVKQGWGNDSCKTSTVTGGWRLTFCLSVWAVECEIVMLLCIKSCVVNMSGGTDWWYMTLLYTGFLSFFRYTQFLSSKIY